ETRGARMVVVPAGPLELRAVFEPFVADPAVDRGQLGDLVHDLGGRVEVPVVAESPGERLQDLPVSTRVALRLDRSLHQLDVPARTRERAVGFDGGRRRQDDVS